MLERIINWEIFGFSNGKVICFCFTKLKSDSLLLCIVFAHISERGCHCERSEAIPTSPLFSPLLIGEGMGERLLRHGVYPELVEGLLAMTRCV
jgi:hypothetical protein